MIERIGIVLAAAAGFAIGAHAQDVARPPAAVEKTCMQGLHRDDPALPAASRRTRDDLIAEPQRIDVVVAEAARAGAVRRAEIELGVRLAANWLKCIDPYGYQALVAYLRAHPVDAATNELNRAMTAESSADAPAANSGAAPGTGGFGASPAAGAPSFATAVEIVSPNH